MGYINYSMSDNAAAAYKDGKAPLSKWNKERAARVLLENGVNFDARRFFGGEWKKELTFDSWHHTSKFYNRTDFYSFDCEELVGKFPATEEDGLAFCREIVEKAESRRQSAAKKKAAAEIVAQKKRAALEKRIKTMFLKGKLPNFKKSCSGKSISGQYGQNIYLIKIV